MGRYGGHFLLWLGVAQKCYIGSTIEINFNAKVMQTKSSVERRINIGPASYHATTESTNESTQSKMTAGAIHCAGIGPSTKACVGLTTIIQYCMIMVPPALLYVSHITMRGQYKDKLGHYSSKDHLDQKRRKAYYTRHGPATNKNTPKYWSHKILW